MKFVAKHQAGEEYLEAQYFDSGNSRFESDLMLYCSQTGRLAKEQLAFAMAQKALETQLNYWESGVSVDISLTITIETLSNGFFGTLNTVFPYTIEATEVGPFERAYRDAAYNIGHLIMGKYQELLQSNQKIKEHGA